MMLDQAQRGNILAGKLPKKDAETIAGRRRIQKEQKEDSRRYAPL